MSAAEAIDALSYAKNWHELDTALAACRRAGVAEVQVMPNLTLSLENTYWLRAGQISALEALMRFELEAEEGPYQA